MAVGCGIGRHHGPTWRNDAIMQDVERHVPMRQCCVLKHGVVRDTWCDA